MVTLSKILRDIQATYPGNIEDFDPITLINWINECYVEIRDEYISNNRPEQFSISQSVPTFTQDKQLTYLKYKSLNKAFIQDKPMDMTIVNVICREHPELRDVDASWSEGDKAWVGNDLYIAVADIDDLNTFDLRFKDCDVRNYHPDNDLKYHVGDVVKEDGLFYRAIQENINDDDSLLNTRVDDWEQVYWRYTGIGFKDPEIVDFGLVDRKKVSIDLGATIASFNRDTMYVSQNVESAKITYVPVHEWKRQNGEEFQIPKTAIGVWRNLVHQKMLMSRGQQVNTDE